LIKRKSIIIFVSLAVLIFVSQNFVIPVIAAPGRLPFEGDNIGLVYKIVNEEFESHDQNHPEIDIVELHNDRYKSLITLELSGLPNLSSTYEYWVLLAWTDYGAFRSITDWRDPNWELAVPANISLTVCVAGGASWFGVVNGSSSVIYNSRDEFLSSEIHNNSVSIVENTTLTFPFTLSMDLIDPYYVQNHIVYTMLNATSSSSERIFYLDSESIIFIDEIFGLAITPVDFTSLPLFSSILACLVVTFRRKTK